jgi:cold shock CspA family protein/ribosome-associated translation inhibitor RaiA
LLFVGATSRYPAVVGEFMMQSPLQLSWRGLEPTPEMVEAIHTRVQKLERAFPELIGCRVLVEVPHHRHRKGNLYHLRVELAVPGPDIIVDRAPQEHQPSESFRVAVTETFKAARRQLEDCAQVRHREVKVPEEAPTGRVSMLFPYEGYGFIRDAVGQDIYFSSNSLVNMAFDEIEEGDEVRFVEEGGALGPQASTVYFVRRSTHTD